MTNEEMEQRIRSAMEHTAPDNLDLILSVCTEQNQLRGRDPLAARGAGAAGNVFRVILDVNPSIYLEVDEEEKVVRAEALNEDAEAILEGKDLCGMPLEEAVDDIVAAMMREGYLSEIQNSILVSVENPDTERKEEVRQKVSGMIEKAMEEGLGGTEEGISVLSQEVDEDDEELAALAAQYGISVGKATLIRKVVRRDEQVSAKPFTFDDLAPLSVNEIALIAQERELSDETISCVGHASDKNYIGYRGALEAALAFADLTMPEVYKEKVKLDVKKGRLVYKVSIKARFGKYKYYLDARTGEMVRCKKDGKQAKYLKKYYKKHYKKYYKKHYKKYYKKYYKKAYKHYGCDDAVLYDPKGVLEKGGNDDMSKKKKYYNYYMGDNTQISPAPAAAPVPVPEGAIGEQAAKEAALSHAGLSESMVQYVNCQPQVGSGNSAHYDVKFVANGMKYKYAVGMFDGAILGRAVKNKAQKGKYVYEGNYHEHYAPAGPGMTQTAPAPESTAASDTPVTPAPQPSAGTMISEQEALQIALNQAGLAQNDLIRWKVKLVTKHGRTIYRFKLKIPGFEHEIDVEAYTGAVTKWHKEYDY